MALSKINGIIAPDSPWFYIKIIWVFASQRTWIVLDCFRVVDDGENEGLSSSLNVRDFKTWGIRDPSTTY